MRLMVTVAVMIGFRTQDGFDMPCVARIAIPVLICGAQGLLEESLRSAGDWLKNLGWGWRGAGAGCVA